MDVLLQDIKMIPILTGKYEAKHQEIRNKYNIDK